MVPTFNVLLEPHLDSPQNAHINLTLRLSQPDKLTGQPLYLFETPHDDAGASHPHILALDDAGQLGLQIEPPPTLPTPPSASPASAHNYTIWRVSRPTVGDVYVRYTATAQNDAPDSSETGQLRLRWDQSGLIGSGASFLPKPANPSPLSLAIQWDLSHCVHGTRAVWSYGEGPGPVGLPDGHVDSIASSVFMVGAIRSFPDASSVSTPPGHSPPVSHQRCSVYWFNTLPGFLEPVTVFSCRMFQHASLFFRDEDSTYRIFLRNGSASGLRGTRFPRSLVLDYSQVIDVETPSDTDIVSLVTREMIHNWVWMWPEKDGLQNLWFSEGIAQFYALYLPVRFGLRSMTYFRETLDDYLCAYYTNPLLGVPMREVENALLLDVFAETVPHMRGFVYFFLIDALLRRRRGERVCNFQAPNPLDATISQFAQQQWAGGMLSCADWLRLLGGASGGTLVLNAFQKLIEGGEPFDLTDITDLIFFFGGSDGLQLEATQQDRLDAGFDTSSLNTKMITGLVPESRAEMAGLSNGDRLVKHTRFDYSRDHLHPLFYFTAHKADGSGILHGEFWPRSLDAVMSFRAVVVPSKAFKVSRQGIPRR